MPNECRNLLYKSQLKDVPITDTQFQSLVEALEANEASPIAIGILKKWWDEEKNI